tara:strand:+ start:366 stop:467 length:102 start_codon:yes stop_codon:yes gene_type:complete
MINPAMKKLPRRTFCPAIFTALQVAPGFMVKLD